LVEIGAPDDHLDLVVVGVGLPLGPLGPRHDMERPDSYGRPHLVHRHHV
jgi:hypothetical protein